MAAVRFTERAARFGTAALLAAGVFLNGGSGPALAQSHRPLEAQLGTGRLTLPGTYLPPAATWTGGVVVWPLESLGFGVRFLVRPGRIAATDLGIGPAHYDVDAGDVTVRGHALSFAAGRTTAAMPTIRYRWFLPGRTELDVGYGWLRWSTSYIDVVLPDRLPDWETDHSRPTLPERRDPNRLGSGFQIDVLAGRRLAERFGVKAGVTVDLGGDVGYVHVVALGTASF